MPLLIIRWIFLDALNPQAAREATFFAPMMGKEKMAYYVYQTATMLLIIVPFFLKIKLHSFLGGLGIIFYLVGLILSLVAIVDFAKSSEQGLRRQGIYRFSRNPMYVGYFLFFLGCVLMSESVVLLISLLCFQSSSHWIIQSEERWCQTTFGEEYIRYQKRVRRYL